MDWQRWVLGGGPAGAAQDYATKKIFGDEWGSVIKAGYGHNITNPQAYKEGHQGTMGVLGGWLGGGGGGQPAAAGGQNPYNRGYATPGKAQAPMMAGPGAGAGAAPAAMPGAGGMMGSGMPAGQFGILGPTTASYGNSMMAGGYQSPYSIGQPYTYGGWGGYGMA